MVVMLAAECIEFHYRADRPILKGVSLTVGKGEVLCLLGPNGAGKTSLLRCLLGLVKAKSGNFFWEGDDMSRFPARKRAKLMAYVPQSTSLSFPYEVREVVLMGRVAHLAPGSAPDKEDRRLAEEAMEEMKILDISHDIFQNLSGGQKQLVLIARAIAQKARLLVMDEPTTGLDFSNQVRSLHIIRSLAKRGLAVLMTSHSPDHAFLVSKKVILLKDGKIFASGAPEDVMTCDSLSALYDTKTVVFDTPVAPGRKSVKTCVPVIDN